MAQLRLKAEDFKVAEIEVIVIGPEKKKDFAGFWDKKEMPFIGIADSEHRIMKLYGQQIKIFKLGRMPAQILINKKGKIISVHYGKSMSDIPSPEDMISKLSQ